MKLLRFGILLLCLCLSAIVRPTAGNAWLMDPPSRSAAWNYGIRAPVNVDFRTLNCGDEEVQIQPDGSRNCGICGDPITDSVPRPNENGGIYANETILTRFFTSGQTAEISIYNNYPNQPGFYEFRLCENGDNPTQACLDNNLLFIEDSNATSMPVPGLGLNIIHVQLPAGLTCSHCMLQWRFKKDNSAWGCDQSTGWCGLGYGAQKEYYNCADVMIGAVGTTKPDVIKDPTYSSADYGSAYDTATTHGPDHTTNNGNGGGRIGTSPPIVTTPRIITVPPFTTPPPTGSTPVTEERLVVIDASDGNNIRTVYSDENNNNNNNNNAGLLLLLGLLPVLGALAQTSSAGSLPLTGAVTPVGGAVVPAAGPLPPLSPSGFWNPGGAWSAQPYLSEFTMGNSFGYGTFGRSYDTNYGQKGNNYGNYGNKWNSYGNAWDGSSLSSVGKYPVSNGFGNNQFGQSSFLGTGDTNFINGQKGFQGLNNMNTWGNKNFVVMKEAYVTNGVNRQPINNPSVSGGSQQSQYPSNQPHQYPTSWQTRPNEYSNNHVDSYKQPGQQNAQFRGQGWNNANSNGFNDVSNNAFSNTNGNVWPSAPTNAARSFNGFNNINNGFSNNMNNKNGFNNWNSGNQLTAVTNGVHTPGFTKISHPKASNIGSNQFITSTNANAFWQQGGMQGASQSAWTQRQPQIHELY